MSLDISLSCNSLTPEQHLQLATPSYKIKKEKREAKKLDSTQSKDNDTLVDPTSVSVIGAVDDQCTVKSPSTVTPPEKISKKPSTSKSTKSVGKKSDTDFKLEELDQKWSDRFIQLEAFLLARSFEPTFSSNVKVIPTHSPPAGVVQGNEPLIRLAQPTSSSMQFPGSSFSAPQHQLTSQTQTSVPTSVTELPGTGSSASQHQPTSQTQTSVPTSVTELPGTGSSASQHQLTSQTQTSVPTSVTELPGTGSSASQHQLTGKAQTS